MCLFMCLPDNLTNYMCSGYIFCLSYSTVNNFKGVSENSQKPLYRLGLQSNKRLTCTCLSCFLSFDALCRSRSSDVMHMTHVAMQSLAQQSFAVHACRDHCG